MRRMKLGVLVLSGLLAMSTMGFAASGLAETAEGAATEYEWSIDLDCSLCHQKEYVSLGLLEADATDAEEVEAQEADAEAAESSEEAAEAEATEAADGEDAEYLAEVSGYAIMHADSFGLSCTTCHTDTEELAKGHKKLNSGKEATRLKKSEVSSEICVACHQVEQLAEIAADYQGLVDSEGTVVNPHDLPQNDSHDGVQCTSCHAVHSGKGIAETAMNTCLGCHHAGVFECNTCH